MDKKKIFLGLVFCVLLFAVFVVADFTLKTQSGDLVLDPASDNVGIGTTSPSVPLHIHTSSSDHARAYFTAAGTGIAGIYFDASNGDMSGGDYGSLFQQNDLSIELNNYGNNPIHLKTNGNDRVTILGDGKVGIGTSSPGEELEISKNQNANTLLEIGNANTGTSARAGITLSDSASEKAFMHWLNGVGVENFRLGTVGAYDLQFFAQNQLRMTIKSSGNVGIGTTTPNSKLEVSSVIQSTPTDSPGTCNSNSEGGMYYDASLNEPCFCDGSNWKQFDGGGNC